MLRIFLLWSLLKNASLLLSIKSHTFNTNKIHKSQINKHNLISNWSEVNKISGEKPKNTSRQLICDNSYLLQNWTLTAIYFKCSCVQQSIFNLNSFLFSFKAFESRFEWYLLELIPVKVFQHTGQFLRILLDGADQAFD